MSLPQGKGWAVLVAGVSGLVGGAVAEALVKNGGHRAWATSRRPPPRGGGDLRFVAADLLELESCRALSAVTGPVDHLIYAAVNESPGDLVAAWTTADHVDRNARMLWNVLEAYGGSLSRVVLVHGSKAYNDPSNPAASFTIPVRERAPRPSHPNFYFAQEDEVATRQASSDGSFSWSVLRAPMVAGGAPQSNLNGLFALALYASLRRESGEPLVYPKAAGADLIRQMVDVRILAQAAVWACDAPQAEQQVFNVTNGECYAWKDLWPIVGEEIGLPAREAGGSFSVLDDVLGRSDLWATVVRRHGLQAPSDLEWARSSLELLDFSLGSNRAPLILSTVKIRQAGFAPCADTESTVIDWIRTWRSEGFLPPR